MRAPVRLLALMPMVIATVAVLATSPSVRAHGAGAAMLTVSQVIRPGSLLEVSAAGWTR